MKQQTVELRASNAHRWMVCHGQPRAVQGMQDAAGGAADKGTVAHALLEVMLRLDLPADEIDRFAGKPMLKFIGEGASKRRADHILVDEQMMDGVSHALAYVRSYLAEHPEADYEVEVLLDASPLVGYETGGTSDIIIADLPREIAVLDYKNGVQYVDHNDNEQLHIYGLGAIAKYLEEVTPETAIRMVIIQPNARRGSGAVREVVYTYDDLMLFAKRASAAAKAANGKNPPRVAGEHCTFCRAAGLCKAYADKTLEDIGLEFSDLKEGGNMALRDPKNMDAKEVAKVVEASFQLRKWLVSVEDEAIRQLIAKNKIPGFRLVGSKPHRRWDDEEAILKVLKKRAADLFEELAPRAPLSVSQMDRRLSRKRDGDPKLLNALIKHITHNPIEPRIAPLDDPRPDFLPGAEFEEDSLGE